MKRDDPEEREIERHQARVAAMSEASCRINESWDLDTVLQEVADGARKLTGARFGLVRMFDDAGQVMQFATSGEPHQPVGSPEEPALLRYLSEIQEPLRLPDFARYSHSDGFPF